jgi:gamma-glutamylputrescine oxidase
VVLDLAGPAGGRWRLRQTEDHPTVVSTTPIEHNYEPTYYEATAGATVSFPPLDGDTRADVAIVGGGFTGLTAALHLAKAGYRVVLLEARAVGAGGSGRNGGLMVPGPRRDQDYLEKAIGIDDARRLWGMYLDARAHHAALVAEHAIDCDLQPGFIHAAHKARYVDEYRAYVERMATVYGYGAMRMLDRAETAEAVGSEAYHGGYYDPNGGHLHPLKMAYGIARAAAGAGATIHEGTRVTAVVDGAGGVRVATERGAVTAAFAVIATDAYSHDLNSALDRHVLPIDCYVTTTEPLAEPHRSRILPGRPSVSDTRFVVNYFRKTRDDRLLFGGGETYGVGRPKDIGAFVKRVMLRIYPQLADVKTEFGWSGRVAITVNRMPYVRRPSRNVVLAAGTCGQGVILAPYYGRVLAEAVQGTLERFDLLASLDVPRFPGGRRLRTPAMMAGMTYYALRDRL